MDTVYETQDSKFANKHHFTTKLLSEFIISYRYDPHDPLCRWNGDLLAGP